MAENIMNSSEMRVKSLDWNLACDVQLRKRLELTAQRFQQKALSLSESIKDLNAKSTVTAAKLGNISILFSISAQIHIFLYQEFSALLNLNPNDKYTLLRLFFLNFLKVIRKLKFNQSNYAS